MTNRRTGLGRGLGALIPGGDQASVGVAEVDVDLIVPNPQQPRSVFAPEALAELAESIRAHGVIQPLIVSHRSGDGVYQLIAGERRLLAARQAGLKRVPVVVKEASEQALLELALVENLQREDLGPLEEAAAFRRLADDFGLTQDAIAVRVARSRSAVANTMRLLTLPPEIQDSLTRGEITAGHARAILGLDAPADQVKLWEQIVRGSLTVRDAEGLARQSARPKTARSKLSRHSADLAHLEEELRSALGTRVDLAHSARGGRITVHYYSDEELEALVQRLIGGGGKIEMERLVHSADRLELIESLKAIPDAVLASVEGLPETALRMRPAEGEWSIKEIVGHLAWKAEVWYGRLYMVSTQTDPILVGRDQDQAVRDHDYQNASSVTALVEEMRQWQLKTVDLLDHTVDWTRLGRHTETGRRSLKQWVEYLLQAEKAHLEQIEVLKARGLAAPGRT